MYTYFLLTDTGLDFVVDALTQQDALEFVQNILDQDEQKPQIVCCQGVHEVASYFEAVQ
jgi:hypothetical protein